VSEASITSTTSTTLGERWCILRGAGCTIR
jgi:hypothetical protein